MKRKFSIVITKEGGAYVARCQELADAVARGNSREETVERIKEVIRKMLGGGSEGGSAPLPRPVSPPPHGPSGPLVVEAEVDDQNDV
jgi:predicted RNase H-like HicB family nuclease